ncbi:MAG TPA: vWA domain-containing protein [Gaiellaceae bacterium]|nr:vWA domain-containing protein [Gaiellaceae bacterium]
MDVRLLTPYGALVAATALVPLGVFVLRARRLRAIGRALGLDSPTLRSQLPLVLALASVPALLGLAAAQPVVETTRTVPERTDAQALVVLDSSRSMLAAAGPGAPTRFERARGLAGQVRAELPEIPFGIATVTDRVLPHLFPTTDEGVFESTLGRAVGVERPPPGAFYLTHATNLNALRDVPAKNYFPPSARKRALVVLTDGETQAPTAALASAFAREPRTHVVLVHVWDEEEAIYETGVAEGGYEPDARSEPALARVASLVQGAMFSEDDIEEVVEALGTALGEGETAARRERSGRIALMPYVTLAALAPLVVVLLGRNVWWTRTRRRERAVTGRKQRAASFAATLVRGERLVRDGR